MYLRFQNMGRNVTYNGQTVYVDNNTARAKLSLASQGFTPDQINDLLYIKDQLPAPRQGKSQYVTTELTADQKVKQYQDQLQTEIPNEVAKKRNMTSISINPNSNPITWQAQEDVATRGIAQAQAIQESRTISPIVNNYQNQVRPDILNKNPAARNLNPNTGQQISVMFQNNQVTNSDIIDMSHPTIVTGVGANEPFIAYEQPYKPQYDTLTPTQPSGVVYDAGQIGGWWYNETIGQGDVILNKVGVGKIVGGSLDLIGTAGQIVVGRLDNAVSPVPGIQIYNFGFGMIKEQGNAIKQKPFSETLLFVTTAEIAGEVYGYASERFAASKGFSIWSKATGTKVITGKALSKSIDIGFSTASVGMIGMDIVKSPNKEYTVGEIIKGGVGFGYGYNQGVAAAKTERMYNFDVKLSKLGGGTEPFNPPPPSQGFEPIDIKHIEKWKKESQVNSNPFLTTLNEKQTLLKPNIELLSGDGYGYYPKSHLEIATTKRNAFLAKDIVTTDYKPINTILYQSPEGRLAVNYNKLKGVGQNKLNIGIGTPMTSQIDFYGAKSGKSGYQRPINDFMPIKGSKEEARLQFRDILSNTISKSSFKKGSKPFWLSTGLSSEYVSEYGFDTAGGGYKIKKNENSVGFGNFDFKYSNAGISGFKYISGNLLINPNKEKQKSREQLIHYSKTKQNNIFDNIEISKSIQQEQFKYGLRNIQKSSLVQQQQQKQQQQEQFKSGLRLQQQNQLIQEPKTQYQQERKYSITLPPEPPKPKTPQYPNLWGMTYKLKKSKMSFGHEKPTPKNYTPSLISVALGLTSHNKKLKKRTFSGAEIRPIIIGGKRNGKRKI